MPPEPKRVRIKLRHGGELRFALLDADAAYTVAVEAIRAKLALPDDGAGKLRVRFRDDEGDMVTLADDEDWTMAMEGVRRAAREEWERSGGVEGGETGRLELWIG